MTQSTDPVNINLLARVVHQTQVVLPHLYPYVRDGIFLGKVLMILKMREFRMGDVFMQCK